VPLALISIAFDPVLRLSDTSSVRYETIALAFVLLLGLLVAARIASRTPAGNPDDPSARLRLDDLVFISVGAVPGAVIGGRLGYVLDHLAYYQASPGAILDAAQGGLTLTLAVPLGILSGALIARLLGAPVGRWLDVAALPLLFVLGAGKLIGILGGTGQGALSDGAWATAYLGPGPWGSLAADLPAQPSQVYEAVAVAVAVVVLFPVSRVPFVRHHAGSLLFAAVGLWSVARLLVGFTWRDDAVVGPLGVEQALAVVLLLLAAVGLAWIGRAPLALASAPPAVPAAPPAVETAPAAVAPAPPEVATEAPEAEIQTTRGIVSEDTAPKRARTTRKRSTRPPRGSTG
jgi:phosphatidylglycerol:prolipoprotein diacylglycerol transferase